MRSRPCRIAFAAVVVVGLAGCAPPPNLGAPEGSYTPATFKVATAGAAEPVAGAAVTAQFFAAAKPQMGRQFVDPDFASGAPGVAVLSHRYWVDAFQSAPAAIGGTITVDGRPHVIVGVMPPRFQPEGAGLVWIPKKP